MSRRGKRTLGPRTYRAVKAVARAAIMKTSETKNTTVTQEGLDVYHNAQISALNQQPVSDAQFFDIWRYNIACGPGVNQRIGTEIMPRGLSLRLYCENLLDRPNLHWRVIIGVAPKTLKDGLTKSAYDNLEMMQGIGGNLIRHIDTELGYKILYDRVFKNEIGTSHSVVSGATWYPKRCHFFKKIWIKRKKGSKISYVAAVNGATAAINNKPVFMAVIPYDSNNTLATDQVGEVNWQAKLYWKDI